MNKNKAKGLTEISVPTGKNKLLQKALENTNKSVELVTLWKVINVNAIDRLGMTDHGITHFQIVANIALRLGRLLHKNDVELSMVKDHGLSHDHAELVLFFSSIMHDLGMSINREGHEEFSLIKADRILNDIIDFLPQDEKVIVISDTLHAIISHRKGGVPYTIEAGILRISDALDMTSGRARISYEAGFTGIHEISHSGIDNVEIKAGEDRPVRIEITMNNSAGIFQVNELLKGKLKGSGLEKYFEIYAEIKRDSEKKLVDNFTIKL